MRKYTFNIKWFAIHALDHCNQKCLYCNNHALYAKKREYLASDYIPHIDKMIDMGILFNQIRISGGEPFLHSDLLKFVKTIKEKYNKSLTIATNLFWLKEESDTDNDVFKYIDIMFPSMYPHNIKKRKLIEMISTKYGTKIIKRIKNVFYKVEFVSKPEKVVRFCSSQAGCTNLLVSGKLSRCATAAYADCNPTVTQEFLDNRSDVFFDLYAHGGNIGEWFKKWPLDACSYCTLWKEEMVKWEKRIVI